MIWGGLSLVGVIGLLGIAAFQLGPGNRDAIDSASVKDVRFVLNSYGLSESRTQNVIHNYVSSRSFTNDHLDTYAIKISHIELAELTSSSEETNSRWYRGDQLPPVVNDAVDFVGGWLGRKEISWFPKEAELRSAEFYVYPWSIYVHGVRPTSAELIFIRPSDKTVFYVSGKT